MADESNDFGDASFLVVVTLLSSLGKTSMTQCSYGKKEKMWLALGSRMGFFLCFPMSPIFQGKDFFPHGRRKWRPHGHVPNAYAHLFTRSRRMVSSSTPPLSPAMPGELLPITLLLPDGDLLRRAHAPPSPHTGHGGSGLGHDESTEVGLLPLLLLFLRVRVPVSSPSLLPKLWRPYKERGFG